MSKKSRLFKIYSEDFLSIFEKNGLKLSFNGEQISEPLYVCPLSLLAYNESSIGALTIEHVPPKSLGGHGIILTEKSINNKDGSTSDKKLLNYFQSLNFKHNGGELGVQIKVGDEMTGGIRAKMCFEMKGSKPLIRFISPKNNLDGLEYKGLFRNWDGGKFHIKFKTVDKIDKKSLLKSAYLIAFSTIGYDLIFDKSGLRTKTYGQLIDYLTGSETGIDFPLVFINDHAPIDNSKLGLINFPQDLSCLVVNLTFSLDNKVFKYAVFLPHPDHPGLDNLIRLKSKIFQQQSNFELQISPILYDIVEIYKKDENDNLT